MSQLLKQKIGVQAYSTQHPEMHLDLVLHLLGIMKHTIINTKHTIIVMQHTIIKMKHTIINTTKMPGQLAQEAE